MLDIITIGSGTRDVYLKSEGVETRKHADSPTGVEQCLPLGSKIEVKEVIFTTGGGGTNAAVTFSRQGLKTGCVGVVGDDFNGKELINELKREKVEPFFSVHPVKFGEADAKQFDGVNKDDLTAYSVILVHPNAERTILSYKGEGQHFNLEEINWKELKAKWFFFDSMGGNYDLLKKAFEHAAASGSKIAFNPGGKELAHGLEKLKPYLAEVDIFSVNKEEAEALLNQGAGPAPPEAIPASREPSPGHPHRAQSADLRAAGGPPVGSPTPLDTLKALDKLVKGITVLTLGPEGVLVSDKQKIYQAGTPDSPKVERTGAGDAFVSGFIAQYILSGGDIVKSIQFATANASSVVAHYGPKAGILHKDDFGPWPPVEVKIL